MSTYVHLLDECNVRIFWSQYSFSNESAQGCMLTIGNHQIHYDLLVPDTPKYDADLGMDWMTKNPIHIDCAKHHVIHSGKNFPLITPPDAQIVEQNIELTVVDQILVIKKKGETVWL